MGRARSATTILLLATAFAALAATVVAADDAAADEAADALAEARSRLFLRAMSARGFHDVAAEIDRTGSFLAAPPAEAAAAIVAAHQTFAVHERDALLLVLLREEHEPDALRGLVVEVVRHVRILRDWSLLALVFERAVEVGHREPAATLAIADRIAEALESPDARSAGYESAAISVARHASATIVPTDAASLALAETFRTIARDSRSPRVVDAVRTSARFLLSIP